MSMHKQNYTPYLMWLLPLLFFTYQFILRLWPGLMMQPIMEQFSIDASHFGIIAAFYYYGYAGMQIPVALLLERFETRYVVFSFATLCGLATLLFTFSDNWILACVSRFLVGAGSAAGFLSVSKVVSKWFPKSQYTRLIGFSFTIGLMGAIYGGKPINLLIETYSWQHIALVLAVLSLMIGVLALCILREPLTLTEQKSSFTLTHFKSLITSPFIWCLAISNLLMVGALEGFSDVWGVPYLMLAYSLSKSDAAQLISYVFVGMLIGGPLLSYVSQKIGNFTVISFCGMGMALIFIVMLHTTYYQEWLLSCLFFSTGMLCCYQVIVFAAGADLVNAELLGVTIAFLNCINMLGGSFFHTIIGKSMDLFWTGTITVDGLKQYDLATYQSALLVIPGCALLGAVIASILGARKTAEQKENFELVKIV